MALLLMCGCFGAVIWIYFYNNPLNHGRKFMVRRLINWLPLGMTYSFLYMGRYNLTVSKGALGSLMSNEDLGWIFAAGTWTYGLSFVVNGPLVDKIGGKKGIIIAAIGSSVANLILGVLTYLALMGRLHVKLVTAFSLVYALNMYFQSYGAMSIIKVKAYWFHVRERGVFGAVFGSLISMGIYFAFDWSQGIINVTKVQPGQDAGQLSLWVHDWARKIFAPGGGNVDAIWSVFFIPAAILVVWIFLDIWLIKDTPEEANFPPFDTHDASSGQMHVELTTWDLLKRVFASRMMLLIAAVSFTAGVLRNGVYQWYFVFAKDVKQPGAEFIRDHWGLLLAVFGIIGGFAGGLISDHFFQSRRGPPAVLASVFMLAMTIVMAAYLYASPIVLGCAAVAISMAVISVHSLMSGTAAADFGGRKATATCSGIVDGFAYLGSGLQSVGIGYLTTVGTWPQWLARLNSFVHRGDWHWWPAFLIPFALLGGIVALSIWHDLPEATRRYIADVEKRVKPDSASTLTNTPIEMD
jgi:OPA family glycerol-3-phosphate transporter-like MFS transporter